MGRYLKKNWEWNNEEVNLILAIQTWEMNYLIADVTV